MKPEKYELLIENGTIYLRGFSAQTQKGFFNVEAVKFQNGSAIPRMRRHGQRLAAHFAIPFNDRTPA